jgi:hypothetical protein
MDEFTMTRRLSAGFPDTVVPDSGRRGRDEISSDVHDARTGGWAE